MSDQKVTVDPDVLEELVETAKGKLEYDTDRHVDPGYDIDAFAATIEQGAEALECAAEPDSLADLHDLPWSEVEGAHLRVRQEVDRNDIMAPASEWSDENVRQEEREGELTGRAEGWGLYYDSGRSENIPTSIGPKIYLETAEDTILEVVTEGSGNELLAYTPPERDTDE